MMVFKLACVISVPLRACYHNLQNYTVKTQQLLQPIVLVTVVPVTVHTTSQMQEVILYWMYVEVEVVCSLLSR